MTAHFILYVADQAASARFWTAVLDRAPRLDAPGMTEFELGEGAVLGLMPLAGIRRLLGDALPAAEAGPDATVADAPRAELYLVREDADACHARALAAGARELSPMRARDWGHEVAYALDADGHVLACARAR